MNDTRCRFGRNRIVCVVTLLGASALLLSCAATEKVDEPLKPLFFPAPPDEPRFVYERTLRSSGDVEIVDDETRWRRRLTGESARGAGMAKPFDVAVCKGRVFVSDTVRRRVLVFDVPRGKYWEVGDIDPGFLVKPLGVATDQDCNLYVADGTQRRVLIYDGEGTYLAALGGTDWFERLSHVAVTQDGSKVFVVDTGGVVSTDHRIRVFDGRSGGHLYDIGTRGTGPGQFNLPRDAEIGYDGRLYVVDGGNFRVQILEQDGSFVRSIGSLGRMFGQFGRPKSVATDGAGNIYVGDASFGNFQIFDQQGRLLLFVGRRSERADRAVYMLPAGIDVDEDGRVYFVDQYFAKVDVYRPASLDELGGFLSRR